MGKKKHSNKKTAPVRKAFATPAPRNEPTTPGRLAGVLRHPRLADFIALTRLDRPIGIYLLLWPTLWALWVAAKGMPSWQNLAIFVLGVTLMRSAGCVINDYADRHVDGRVARTRSRPLATGRVTPREALILFAVLVTLSFVLVLFTNAATVWLSFGALALAACYPFMKRYTFYPQVVLGAAFSWGMPMAFTAETGGVPPEAWLLYFANLLWTVAYDTYYAMTDREDDLKIGVKSTAILFGEADRAIIATLQGLAVLCLLLAGARFKLGLYFHLSLLVAVGCFAWQFWSTRSRDPQACLKAFLHNHWVGLAIFIGLVLDYALRP
ncbi:MAG: 4-hydroxybenzoate octaprenyltransferase [Pseudomonadota bacterium]